MNIRRGPEESKQSFLDRLCQIYPKLEVCYSYTKDGELGFSKWVKWMKLQELNDSDIVPDQPFSITKKSFVEKTSHRSILADIEILFDIDDEYMFRSIIQSQKQKEINVIDDKYNAIEENLKFETIKEKSQWVIEELKSVGKYPTITFTGNKSYHLSLIVSEFRDMSVNERRRIKQEVLDYYGCDSQKSSERVMIAMEGATHYRSGKPKMEVEL